MVADAGAPQFEAPGESRPQETAAMGAGYIPEPGPTEAGGDVGSSLLGIDGVEGVGVGRDRLGRSTLVVYVRDRAVGAGLPSEVGGMAVVVEVVGRIDAFGGSAPE
jgi:hypothetical protein